MTDANPLHDPGARGFASDNCAGIYPEILEAAVRGVDGVEVQRPVEANAVFAILPLSVTERLQRRYPFYVWDEKTGEVRWMTSFDITEANVDGFAVALRDELATDRSR